MPAVLCDEGGGRTVTPRSCDTKLQHNTHYGCAPRREFHAQFTLSLISEGSEGALAAMDSAIQAAMAASGLAGSRSPSQPGTAPATGPQGSSSHTNLAAAAAAALGDSSVPSNAFARASASALAAFRAAEAADSSDPQGPSTDDDTDSQRLHEAVMAAINPSAGPGGVGRPPRAPLTGRSSRQDLSQPEGGERTW